MSLKELKALAPWNWDSQATKHPPGRAALQDFEKIEASWRQDAKADSLAQTPGPAATPRERRRSGGLSTASEHKQGWPTPASTGQGRKAASADRVRSLLKRKAPELQTPMAQRPPRDQDRQRDRSRREDGQEEGDAPHTGQAGAGSAPKSMPTARKEGPSARAGAHDATPGDAGGTGAVPSSGGAAAAGGSKVDRTPAPSAARDSSMRPPRWTPAVGTATGARGASGRPIAPSPIEIGMAVDFGAPSSFGAAGSGCDMESTAGGSRSEVARRSPPAVAFLTAMDPPRGDEQGAHAAAEAPEYGARGAAACEADAATAAAPAPPARTQLSLLAETRRSDPEPVLAGTAAGNVGATGICNTCDTSAEHMDAEPSALEAHAGNAAPVAILGSAPPGDADMTDAHIDERPLAAGTLAVPFGTNRGYSQAVLPTRKPAAAIAAMAAAADVVLAAAPEGAKPSDAVNVAPSAPQSAAARCPTHVGGNGADCAPTAARSSAAAAPLSGAQYTQTLPESVHPVLSRRSSDGALPAGDGGAGRQAGKAAAVVGAPFAVGGQPRSPLAARQAMVGSAAAAPAPPSAFHAPTPNGTRKAVLPGASAVQAVESTAVAGCSGQLGVPTTSASCVGIRAAPDVQVAPASALRPQPVSDENASQRGTHGTKDGAKCSARTRPGGPPSATAVQPPQAAAPPPLAAALRPTTVRPRDDGEPATCGLAADAAPEQDMHPPKRRAVETAAGTCGLSLQHREQPTNDFATEQRPRPPSVQRSGHQHSRADVDITCTVTAAPQTMASTTARVADVPAGPMAAAASAPAPVSAQPPQLTAAAAAPNLAAPSTSAPSSMAGASAAPPPPSTQEARSLHAALPAQAIGAAPAGAGSSASTAATSVQAPGLPSGVSLNPTQLQVLNQLLCHFRDTGCRHPAAMSGPELVAAISSFCKSAGIPPVPANIQTLASWLGTLLALERPVKAYAQAQAEARARAEAEAETRARAQPQAGDGAPAPAVAATGPEAVQPRAGVEGAAPSHLSAQARAPPCSEHVYRQGAQAPLGPAALPGHSARPDATSAVPTAPVADAVAASLRQPCGDVPLPAQPQPLVAPIAAAATASAAAAGESQGPQQAQAEQGDLPRLLLGQPQVQLPASATQPPRSLSAAMLTRAVEGLPSSAGAYAAGDPVHAPCSAAAALPIAPLLADGLPGPTPLTSLEAEWLSQLSPVVSALYEHLSHSHQALRGVLLTTAPAPPLPPQQQEAAAMQPADLAPQRPQAQAPPAPLQAAQPAAGGALLPQLQQASQAHQQHPGLPQQLQLLLVLHQQQQQQQHDQSKGQHAMMNPAPASGRGDGRPVAAAVAGPQRRQRQQTQQQTRSEPASRASSPRASAAAKRALLSGGAGHGAPAGQPLPARQAGAGDGGAAAAKGPAALKPPLPTQSRAAPRAAAAAAGSALGPAPTAKPSWAAPAPGSALAPAGAGVTASQARAGPQPSLAHPSPALPLVPPMPRARPQLYQMPSSHPTQSAPPAPAAPVQPALHSPYPAGVAVDDTAGALQPSPPPSAPVRGAATAPYSPMTGPYGYGYVAPATGHGWPYGNPYGWCPPYGGSTSAAAVAYHTDPYAYGRVARAAGVARPQRSAGSGAAADGVTQGGASAVAAATPVVPPMQPGVTALLAPPAGPHPAVRPVKLRFRMAGGMPGIAPAPAAGPSGLPAQGRVVRAAGMAAPAVGKAG